MVFAILKRNHNLNSRHKCRITFLQFFILTLKFGNCLYNRKLGGVSTSVKCKLHNWAAITIPNVTLASLTLSLYIYINICP